MRRQNLSDPLEMGKGEGKTSPGGLLFSGDETGRLDLELKGR